MIPLVPLFIRLESRFDAGSIQAALEKAGVEDRLRSPLYVARRGDHIRIARIEIEKPKDTASLATIKAPPLWQIDLDRRPVLPEREGFVRAVSEAIAWRLEQTRSYPSFYKESDLDFLVTIGRPTPRRFHFWFAYAAKSTRSMYMVVGLRGQRYGFRGGDVMSENHLTGFENLPRP